MEYGHLLQTFTSELQIEIGELRSPIKGFLKWVTEYSIF